MTTAELDHLAARVAELLAPAIANTGAPSSLVDAEAAGAQLGVPASWVLAEARADRIPHERLGRYVRFRPADLDAWLNARHQPARGTRTDA